MRSILLVGSVLCLALLAPPTLAEAIVVDAATAPDAATAAAEEPLPALAEPAAEPAVGTACAAEPQPLSNGFGPYCGDYCPEPWAEDYCVGYDCSGTLYIGPCHCLNSRWYCQWQQDCPPW